MKIIKRLLTALLLLALVACAVVFALSNPATVEVDFLAFKLTASAAIWIVGALVVGGLLGLLAGTGVFFRLKTTQVRSSRKIKRYEQEISKIQAGSA
jgi:putative membrane protein